MPPRPAPTAASPRRQHWVAAARRAWANQREAHERLIIQNRPWSHDQLHWVPTAEGGVELHGSAPAPGRSRGPVTSGGWCPCAAAREDGRRLAGLVAGAGGDLGCSREGGSALTP